jgi:hypothetical protein
MTTPAIVPAAMISLVALAAARERRGCAMALWLGMALALSGWALLVAAALAPTTIRERWTVRAVPIVLLSASAATLVLRAAALPHAVAGWGIGPVLFAALLGAIGLVVPKLASRPLLLTHRLG